MLHFFLVTVGRRCENVACPMRGKQVDRHAEFCEECHRTLVPVREVAWKTVAIAAAVIVVLASGLVYLTHSYLQRRAAEREAQLLSRATGRFQAALRGATASDVETIAQSVQAEMQLTDEQRQRVLASSRNLIAHLPRALTPDIQQRLELLVRNVYEDGRVSHDEQAVLDRFTQDQRVAPQAVQKFKGKLADRLDESYRSVSQGRSFAAAGKYEEALSAFQRATEVDSGNAMAWANLGAMYGLLRRDAEARSCYDKALSLNPENWLAHYNLGLLAARSGDREAAFQHIERTLSTLPARANQERREVIDGLLREPDFEELRRDPRFPDLLGGSGERGAQP